MDANTNLHLLRHALATLAYRGGKAIGGVSGEVSRFRVTEGVRTPVEILAHIGDLLDWALRLADGKYEWTQAAPLEWEQESRRFFAALEALDARLASGVALGYPVEKVFQGPIADALTHVGQIAMVRRMGGEKMKAENYFRAEIAVGRVGADQAKPVREF